MSKTDQRKPRVSQGYAARFYTAAYLKQHPFSWITLPAWIIHSILQWSLPSLILADVISNLQQGNEINYVLEISKMLGLFVVGQIIGLITLHLMSIWQVRAADGIMKDSYANLLDKSLSFHASNFAGSTATKMTKLAGRSVAFIDTLHFNIGDYLAALFFTIYVLGSDGLVGLTMLLATILVYMLVTIPRVRQRLRLVEVRTREESKRTGVMIDGVTNISAIKSFGQEDYEQDIFDTQVDKAGRLTVRSWLYNIWKIDPITALFYLIMAYLPLFYLTQTSDTATLDGGRVFIVYVALVNLGAKIWDISRIWRNIEQYLAECVEGLEILAEPQGVTDAANAKNMKVTKSSVEFKNVSFGYEGGSLYENFDLSIKPGQKVGLVGPSGGGKTTFVKLIMRFMDVTGGEILISGTNIASVKQRSLRRNISYIPQEPALFHRTIAENIAYDNPRVGRKEIVAAAKKAHAHEFVSELKDGYDTVVGERGVKLSGGQRQRVAIARAFLKDAPILVLDEATSALDSESEVLIQEALVKLMKGRTVVSIAHRLSTLRIMDKLVVIENGAIRESGTHDELLTKRGKYAELWSHQSGGFIEE